MGTTSPRKPSTYPGFTIGGLGEELGLVATFVLLLGMPARTAAFWWTLAGFVTLAAMHVVLWTVTQPADRFWLAGTSLTRTEQSFFSIGQSASSSSRELDTWKRLRDRWEYSHIVRAVLAPISLVSGTIAIILYGSAL